MSKLKINITANFLGNILVAVFSLLFVPFYIKYLGIEAYGLIGFSISLRALTLVLDFGMGTSVSRALAQLTVRENKNVKNIRNTLKTFEWVYLINAVLIAVVLTALAPWLSTHWIQARGLTVETLFHSLVLMGWSIAVLWPFNLYSFALQGLQKQVLQNFIGVFFALAKGLVTLFVLKNVSANIELFFLCQLVIYALQTLCTYVVVWMTIPASKTKAVFKKSIFENSFKFFIKVGLISLLASLILQLDKITLSKLLPLEQFGYYSLAWALAGGLYYFIYPIGMAIFPHMTQLAFKKNETALKNTYHSSSQLLSVILFPIVLLLYFFSPQVLRLWINQAQTVTQVAPLLSLIVVAVALNGLTQPSYFLQFAYGKTKLLFWANLISVFILGPLYFFAAREQGLYGVCYLLMAYNFIYLLLTVWSMHRHLLKGEKWRWFWNDICDPLLAAATVVIAARYLMNHFLILETSRLFLLPFLAFTLALSFLAAALSASKIRSLIIK